MVVRFENLWIVIPLMLIPISFAILMMGLVRVWMFSAPTKVRRRPKYSMHVLRDQKEPPGYTNHGQRTNTDNSRTITSYSDDQNVQSYSDEGGRLEKILPARFYDEYPRQVITPRQNVNMSSGFATPSSGYGRKDYDERQVLTEAKFM